MNLCQHEQTLLNEAYHLPGADPGSPVGRGANPLGWGRQRMILKQFLPLHTPPPPQLEDPPMFIANYSAMARTCNRQHTKKFPSYIFTTWFGLVAKFKFRILLYHLSVYNT